MHNMEQKTIKNERQHAKGLTVHYVEIINKMETETRIGGIAAFIGLVSIIIEVALNGFSAIAIAAGIKDFSTTVVAALVLIVAVRKLKPKSEKETYQKVLEEEIARWVRQSDPMIQLVSNPSKGDPIQYNMITNHDIMFYIPKDLNIEDVRTKASIKGPGSFTGLFVSLPDETHPELQFYLNDSTFKKRRKDSSDNESIRRELSQAFSKCISDHFRDFCLPSATSNGDSIKVSFREKLSTPEHARKLVRLIEYVMNLYIFAA